MAEKIDLCHNGCELFRIAKQRVGKKKDNGLVVLKMKVGW